MSPGFRTESNIKTSTFFEINNRIAEPNLFLVGDANSDPASSLMTHFADESFEYLGREIETSTKIPLPLTNINI